jgi:acyl dehydratase
MKPFKGGDHRRIEFSGLALLVGQELGCSDWVEVTQADVDKFADATGDHEWIHVDVPRATKAFGAPVAHGYLTLALLPMLSQSMIETVGMRNGLNYGLDRLRFTNIVHVGQRVRLRQKMVDVTPKRGGLLVTKEVTVEIEHEDRPALVAEALFLLFPETADGAVDRN